MCGGSVYCMWGSTGKRGFYLFLEKKKQKPLIPLNLFFFFLLDYVSISKENVTEPAMEPKTNSLFLSAETLERNEHVLIYLVWQLETDVEEAGPPLFTSQLFVYEAHLIFLHVVLQIITAGYHCKHSKTVICGLHTIAFLSYPAFKFSINKNESICA